MNKKLILPVGLILAIILAYINSSLGIFLGRFNCIEFLVILLFFIYGYKFDFKNGVFKIRVLKSTIVIILSTLIIIPFVGMLIGYLFFSGMLLLGFIIITSMPPTLSSGIVITANSEGDELLAAIYTIVLNITGIFIIPLIYKVTLSSYGNINIKPIAIFYKLVIIILIPLLIGVVVRELFPKYTKSNCLTIMPSIFVIIITFISICYSMAVIKSDSIYLLLVIVLGALTAHFIFMAINYTISRKIMRYDIATVKAFVFVGSQKTLPIAMVVLFSIAKNKAILLATTVMVIYYIVQLIADSIISAGMKKKHSLHTDVL